MTMGDFARTSSRLHARCAMIRERKGGEERERGSAGNDAVQLRTGFDSFCPVLDGLPEGCEGVSARVMRYQSVCFATIEVGVGPHSGNAALACTKGREEHQLRVYIYTNAM